MSKTTEEKIDLKAKALAAWIALKDWGFSDYQLAKEFLVEHKAWALRAVLATLAVIIAWPFIASFMRGTGELPATEPISNHVILRNLGLMVAGFVGVGLAWWRAKSLGTQARVAEQGLITDRFIKASEQLGHKEMAVRLGAIHSLWRIAMDSPSQNDKAAVLDMLCAFVRTPTAMETRDKTRTGNTKSQEDKEDDQQNKELRSDVNSIIKLLGKRIRDIGMQQNYIFNFSNAQLEYCELVDANLWRANLRGANLNNAVLEGAFLREADLYMATLQDANLTDADLTEANLDEANLCETQLEDAVLTGASLENAYLWGANLSGADLRETNLWGANLSSAGLEEANLRGALLRKSTIQGASFHMTNLEMADLREANLRRSSFENAVTHGTAFGGADFKYSSSLSQKQLDQISPLSAPICGLPEGLTIPEDKIQYDEETSPQTDNTSG